MPIDPLPHPVETVIQPVDSSATSDAPHQSAPTTGARSKTFASVLQAASASVPNGETWGPVPGRRDYAKIISGPRKGMYINLSTNERHGLAFKIEQRDGKTVHVYTIDGKEVVAGGGLDPQMVIKRGHRQGVGAASDQPPKGETWAPVPGTTEWADILNGPRNGLFVNISGNDRDGMAFESVKRGGKTYHVYGSGSHRVMIPVDPPQTGSTGQS